MKSKLIDPKWKKVFNKEIAHTEMKIEVTEDFFNRLQRNKGKGVESTNVQEIERVSNQISYVGGLLKKKKKKCYPHANFVCRCMPILCLQLIFIPGVNFI